MPFPESTRVGQVASVTGSIVRVRLREDMPSTLVMIEGESHRVGQVGGYFRIPLGYVNLYGICTQVGADAAPSGTVDEIADAVAAADSLRQLSGYRWMTMALFGEALGDEFERGVSQYPTVGDEVHLVTNHDLGIIYGWSKGAHDTISVGHIASTTGIPADINVAGLVSRHGVVVGSTGSGKSNFVAVLMEALSDGTFPRARAIVIDPHGEYATALGARAQVFRVRPDESAGERRLSVPFWALPFAELQQLTLGEMQPIHEATVRDAVRDMKIEAAKNLAVAVPAETLSADSPVPFSVKRLWYELDRFERITFESTKQQDQETAYAPDQIGDPKALRSDRYPEASAYNNPPYKNQKKRNIGRQLDLMRSRLRDGRFSFLFAPDDGYEPDLEGQVEHDLDSLVREWVGHPKPVTIFDVSELPADVLPTVVGTMLRVVYDMLFWAQDLSIGGRQQPLLVVVDEAHRFVPDGEETPAHRTLSTIAKEGRKYGVGLVLVSQRPAELDGAVMSQCGSMIALRTTNAMGSPQSGRGRFLTISAGWLSSCRHCGRVRGFSWAR